ncbi:MAG: 5-formyltetrahydrofolate cyclo-ligase [Snowella sp.]|nr:5-formyltetrahydrofolate cyclo-ligase [Snowella sp.]
MNKVQLRRQLLEYRQSLPLETWRENSDRLCQHLQTLPLFQSARTILAYFSIRQEPDLQSLWAAKSTWDHRWGFPRCVGQDLTWHQWNVGDPLETGAYNILQPIATAPPLTAAEVDLILVPSVACDRRCYRLGYGGGFYDRLLADPQWASLPALGLIFEFAYLPTLPTDPWDIQLSGICTEKTFYFLNK